MKNILSSLFIFAAGAGIGSVVTWKLLKTKYEQIAQEEIESVKEVFARIYDPENKETESVEENADEEQPKLDKPKTKAQMDFEDMVDIIEEQGYAEVEKGGPGPMANSKPYVIEPEEFGESDYETVTLTYYTDGVLADDGMYIIEDVADVVGEDFAEHFGEYEDDSVHIRNDARQIDYEILQEARAFSDVVDNGAGSNR